MSRAPVSAVIPVRNGAPFIGEALRSIFDQTWPPQEVIVVDDGSSDETGTEVRRYPDVTYVRQPPLGQAEAKNHGARLASMPYLSFLDADDLWVATKTERQLSLLSANPALDYVTGQMVQFSGSVSEGMTLLSAPAVVHSPALMLMRRDTFWKIGPFSSEWLLSDAVEWWSRAVDLGLRGQIIPAVVLMRRIHGRNLGLTVPNPMRDYLRALHAIVNRRRSKQ